MLSAKNVGPEARVKLRNLIKHYRKFAHPFTACVRDNRKRFGPIRARLVCATLKDVMKGTTTWRKGRQASAMAFSDDQLAAMFTAPEVDDEVMCALNQIDEGRLELALAAAEEAATMKLEAAA